MIDDHPFYPHIPGGNQAGNVLLIDGRGRAAYSSRRDRLRISKTCFSCGERFRAHERVGDGVVALMEDYG